MRGAREKHPVSTVSLCIKNKPTPNRAAPRKLDINCGWIGQRMRKSTSGNALTQVAGEAAPFTEAKFIFFVLNFIVLSILLLYVAVKRWRRHTRAFTETCQE